MNEIHQNLTTEQKVQILTQDFLERDSETFVQIRKDGRLGWENTLESDSAYSDYVLHPESEEDLIKNAYRLAGDMITVMDAPFKVKVRITSASSCTDSQTVWVATKVFDDKDLSIGRKLDTFLGLTIHEGCHLLYTDFNALHLLTSQVVANLQNIIEDERIERECGQRKPGLANFLKASKYYYFDKYRQDIKTQGGYDTLDTFARLFNCILSYVRYPKSIELSDIEEFADPLLKVRDILLAFPTCTRESVESAEKIYEVIKEYMTQQEPDYKQSGSGKGDDGGAESSDSCEESSHQSTSPKPRKRSAKQKAKAAQEKIDRGMKELSEALKNITKYRQTRSLDESDQSETVKKDNQLVGQICEERLDRGTQANTYIRKGKEVKNAYMESLDRVRRYVPAISRALKCSSMEYKLIHRGMRSGVLDTGKLAEAFQGVPTVYMREGEVRTEKIAVSILIDESGSMWNSGDIPARDTAVLLNEALSTVPNVELFIYGHTACGENTELYLYRDSRYKAKYVLGSTDARAGNNDSIAIREVAANVRKQTKEKCLFFIISDGAPNESPARVKKAVEDVEKQGFYVVAISIDPHYDPSLMYRRNVNLSDMSRLAIDLGKLVKKAIIDNTTKTVQ